MTNQPSSNTAGAEPVAWTGSGSLRAVEAGQQGYIWATCQKAHPIPLYAHPPQRPSAVPDEVVEAMGEALFALSDRLRSSGFLISDFNHASYERVVKAWGALTAAIAQVKEQDDGE